MAARKKNTTAGNKQIKKKSSNVPQQYLGFSLQTKLLLASLLEADTDSVISLEVFDDVGIEKVDGTKTAIQMKSVTSNKNPVGDYSVDFWKTISNWVDAVEAGEFNVEKSYFEIYVTKPLTDSIVSSFKSANTNEAASNVVKDVRERFFKSPTELVDDIPTGIREFVLNAFKREKTLVTIIQRFSLKTCNGDIYKELENIMKKIHVPEEIIEKMIIGLLGWVTSVTDRLLIQKKPACVAQREFNTEYISMQRTLDFREMLSSLSIEPSVSEIEHEQKKESVYVKQLELVDGSDDEKIMAISDYLRAAADRTLWAQWGWIHRDSFTFFEGDLKRAWKNVSDEIQITHENYPPVKQGKLLYIRCRGKELQLDGKAIPGYFVPGCYHVLSDSRKVGWHPNYLDELKKHMDSEENKP